jgi:hypothetical protein
MNKQKQKNPKPKRSFEKFEVSETLSLMHLSLKKVSHSQEPVAHACNPSHIKKIKEKHPILISELTYLCGA